MTPAERKKIIEALVEYVDTAIEHKHIDNKPLNTPKVKAIKAKLEKLKE